MRRAQRKPEFAAIAPRNSFHVETEHRWVTNRPTETGKTLGAELARLTDAAMEETRDRFPDAPERCKSCALRAGTIPNGCESTLVDLVKCVAELHPFLCHEHRDEDGKLDRLCAGYAAILTMLPPDTKRTPVPWEYSPAPPEGA